MSEESTHRTRAPDYVFVGSVCFLSLVWIIFLAMDVWGAPYAPFVFLSEHVQDTLFFMWAFGQAGPVELFQWLALGMCLGLIGRLIHRSSLRQPSLSRVILAVGALGLAVMLLEDMVNVRHRLALTVVVPLLNAEPKGLVRTLTEMTFYAMLATLMITFFLGAVKPLTHAPRAAQYFVAGYIFYGIAALASASRYVGDWYTRVGTWVVESTAPDIVQAFSEGYSDPLHPVGYWFMDRLLEESIELIAASALLAGLLHYSFHLDRQER